MVSRGHGGYGWRYGLIDLSSNMNPLGTPRELVALIKEAVEQGHYSHYPTELGDELREALANYEGSNLDTTYVFNGATEALQILTMYLRPKHVIIPIPNYSDYSRTSRLIGAEIIHVEYWGYGSLRNLIMNKVVMHGSSVLLSNPNSPMGYMIPRDELLSLAEDIGKYGGYLVVDESFMDFVANEQSLIRYVNEHDNIIVVKSYTKFLAIPGLRVGAVYTRVDVEDLVPTWPVNSIAEYAVSRYMRYAHSFREETINYVNSEMGRILTILNELGVQHYDSATHFFVIRDRPWFGEELRKRGFLIRDLSNVPPLSMGYFRVSIRDRTTNNEFLRALREVIQIN